MDDEKKNLLENMHAELPELELLLYILGRSHADLRVQIGPTQYCLPASASECARALLAKGGEE